MIDLKKIDKELEEIPKGWIVLLETNSENVLTVSTHALKVLTDKEYMGVILSVSRPYRNLVELYTDNKINMKKLFIVDCISMSHYADEKGVDNVLYLQNVSDIELILSTLTEVIEKIEGKKFLFIDSITSMLIHIQPRVFMQFMHFIMIKMRIWGINGLLISMESKSNQEIRAEIVQLCDKAIKL